MSLIISFLIYAHDFTTHYEISEIKETNTILFFDDFPDRPPAASPS